MAEVWSKIFKCNTALMREWIEFVECTNDVLTGNPTLVDLGVRPLTEFELVGGQIAFLRLVFQYFVIGHFFVVCFHFFFSCFICHFIFQAIQGLL